MKKLIIVLSVFCFVSCTSSSDFEKGKEILTQQGFTDIKEDGYSFFCCGDDYTFKTGWIAKDKSGKTVKGCMCSAFFKGMTIKYK